MKKAWFLIWLFLKLNILGQTIQIEPHPVFVNQDIDISDAFVVLKSVGNIINDEDSTFLIRWEIFIDEAPDVWQWYVCDENNCYSHNATTNVQEGGLNNPVMLENYEVSPLDFYVRPKGVGGVGKAQIKLSLADFPTDYIYTADYTFCINSGECIVGVEDVELTEAALYPNPVLDKFELSTVLDSYRSITIYNFFGQLVKTFDIQTNADYSLADLPSGVYLAIVLDQYKYPIHTQKLQKI